MIHTIIRVDGVGDSVYLDAISMQKTNNQKLFVLVVKEMGRWKTLGIFNNKRSIELEQSNIKNICKIIQARSIGEQHLKKFLDKEMVPTWDHHNKIRNRLFKQADF